ncbi:MAG: Ig-like domain-containing protein, partial [Oscillospiraceae bacterium]|nr:Ig-like domain-containing protein [Oscillospiraceae bacterium]
TVYDVVGFAETGRAEKYKDGKVSSAYEIAEYMMCYIMSGEGWVQDSGFMNSGYAITFEPNINTITEVVLRHILRETALFIYAYFPHHHHMIYTFIADSDNYYTVTLMVAQSVKNDHKQWQEEYDEAANLTAPGSIINSGSETENMRAAYKYLAETVVYSKSAPNKGQHAHNALNQKKAVCNGYALAYSMLCFRMELNVPYMAGDVIRKNKKLAHAWNLNLTEYVKTGSPTSINSIDSTWGRVQTNNGALVNVDYFHFNRALDSYRTASSNIEQRVWSPYYESYIAYVNGIEDYELHPGMIFYTAVTDAELREVPLYVGAPRTLSLDFTPAGATPLSVEWSIEDPEYGVIDKDSGMITPLKDGKITVSAVVDGEIAVSGELEVLFQMDYNEDLIAPGSSEGFEINLTKETITIPEAYTVLSFSTDGGITWKNLSKADVFSDVNFPKLLNKGLTLHIADTALNNTSKKPVEENLRIITFPSIKARPKAPALVINYELGADKTGRTAGYWLLTKRKETTAVKENIEIAAADAANKNKTVDKMGWGTFREDDNDNVKGIPVYELTGTKAARTQYFIRSAPVKEDNSTYTPASKPKKIRASSELKPPKYKPNKKTGEIKIKAGTYVSIGGSEPELYEKKETLSPAITMRIWQMATVKKPVSAKQNLS